MPDWNTLLGDLSAAQLILWLVAAGLLVGLLFKLWPFIKNSVAIVDALVKLPELAERVDEIHHETHKNDGSSLKDSNDRIEAAVGVLTQSVEGLHGRMDTVERDVSETKSQITKLAAADDELWASIESTHPSEATMTRRALRAARERRTITGDDIPK